VKEMKTSEQIQIAKKFYDAHRGDFVMIDYDCRCIICDASGQEGRAVSFGEKFVCPECKKNHLAKNVLEEKELHEKINYFDNKIDDVLIHLAPLVENKRVCKLRLMELRKRFHDPIKTKEAKE